MNKKAIQDFYPDELAYCYGCGRLNEHGYQIKTFWDGNETVTHFKPKPYHTAIPGFVYGGLIASLIDCHGTGTAAAAAYKAENRAMDTQPAFRYITASLKVDYLKPTPIGKEIEIRGHVAEIKGRKVIVDITLSINNETCAKGQVIAVQIPENFSGEKSST